MNEKRHPYAWRTQMRTWLPWFLIDLGIAAKGEDCEKSNATHRWYHIDTVFSGCYHCKVEREGKLWKAVHDKADTRYPHLETRT